jgi:hypothetical protein
MKPPGGAVSARWLRDPAAEETATDRAFCLSVVFFCPTLEASVVSFFSRR